MSGRFWIRLLAGAACLALGAAVPPASADTGGAGTTTVSGESLALESAAAPTVISVSYQTYQWPNFKGDVVYADWGGTPIPNRVYGTPGASTNAPNMLLNPFPSILRDGGTPRSRVSYHVGVCVPACDEGGTSNPTWGPWFHPHIPDTVDAPAPSLTATSPTKKTSPGVKITVDPGAHAGAPVFLIYNYDVLVARVGPDNLTYVDNEPQRPKNSYQVRACYADCNRPDWPFDDGYKPTSAFSAPAVAWASTTLACKLLGPTYYSAGLNWQSVCKP